MLARIQSAAQILPVLVSSLALSLSSGCELLDVGGDAGKVQMFATHHGTPTNGVFPSLGTENRTFENDRGWTIDLRDGYVVTSSLEIFDCEGSSSAIEMYRGQVPENILAQDLDPEALGIQDVRATDYCTVAVNYGPYAPQAERSAGAPAPKTAAVEGATLYLMGFATRNGRTEQFTIRASAPLRVELEIADAEGNPLTVSGDAFAPVELLISKTYDRFFDGVDFANYDADEVGQRALEILARETRVSIGMSVRY